MCEVDQVLAVQASDVQGDLLSAVKARCVEEVVGIAERYKELQELGFHGPQFQTLVQVWRGKAEFAARLRSARAGGQWPVPRASSGAGRRVPAGRACRRSCKGMGSGGDRAASASPPISFLVDTRRVHLGVRACEGDK